MERVFESTCLQAGISNRLAFLARLLAARALIAVLCVLATTSGVCAMADDAGAAGLETEGEIPEWVERADQWRGFTRWHFQVGERAAYVVIPEKPLGDRPWIWRARFPEFHAEADGRLVAAGFHLVYLDVAGWFGAPEAIDDADRCYKHVVEALQLNSKVALEGVSRGGLFVYQFLLRFPERVACLYADTPVMDFRSWPAGWGESAGAAREWELCLKRWGLSEDQAREFSEGPIDRAEEIARCGVPLLHIVSENDRVVPPAENTDLFREALSHWGGHLETIRVHEGTAQSNGHHFTHPDVNRVVEFMMRHATKTTPGEPVSEITTRPNIVVFLVDDMGWQDTSVPFTGEMTELNRRYRTPNMERLATSGVVWTQAYSCSVCSPTRISLMTGQNAARHRVTNWTLRRNASNDARHPRLDFPDWNVNGLSPVAGVERTVVARPLAQVLSDQGYHTIHVGKAHFGAVGTPGADPLNLGFETNIGGHAAGGPGSYLGTQNFSAVWRKADPIWDVPGLEEYHGKDVFLTEALTDKALEQIDRSVSQQRPFFLYLAHYAVHVPFAPDSRFIDRYVEAGLGKNEAMYAALVEGMDASLGRVLDRLEQHGQLNQTLVVFVSDNGGLSAHGRDGKPHTHNRPLSSGKGSAHEGGVRVPMIVSWPGVIPAGVRCEQTTLIEDLYPTLLQVAGVAGDPTQTIDGRSQWGYFQKPDRPTEDRRLVWHFPNNWGPRGPGIGPTSSLRRGRWKLVYYHDLGSFELFDLEADLSETTNRVADHPELVASLASELTQLLTQRGAQMPTVRETGQVVPWPQEAWEQSAGATLSE